ncbi:hypothetical protein [Massilia glaciei]|uniref:Uncharacterized protein n=1 Tax=Massilia glaciei TaxID=1524097 RepID=A0A2U2I5Y9_9BURK|nr:hypothetical protein [Massilia glaciei]PWF55166.1 hypothetical protein C7C56_003030 [Massilia glaciei]
MSRDDDDDWFAVIAGGGRPLAAPATIQEAQLVRDAILALHAQAAAPGGEHAGLERLRARLAAEGLLDQPEPVSWSKRLPLALAAMLVAGIGLSLTVMPQLPGTTPGDDAPMRGSSSAQLVLLADPQQAAVILDAQLAKLGVSADATDLGDAVVIEAFVPSQVEPQVNALLKQYQVRVGNNGHLLLRLQRAR